MTEKKIKSFADLGTDTMSLIDEVAVSSLPPMPIPRVVVFKETTDDWMAFAPIYRELLEADLDVEDKNDRAAVHRKLLKIDPEYQQFMSHLKTASDNLRVVGPDGKKDLPNQNSAITAEEKELWAIKEERITQFIEMRNQQVAEELTTIPEDIRELLEDSRAQWEKQSE